MGTRRASQAGFTIIEMMISTMIMVAVTGVSGITAFSTVIMGAIAVVMITVGGSSILKAFRR